MQTDDYTALLQRVFCAVAAGSADSRAALARTFSIARSTAGTHVDALIRRGLLVEALGTETRVGRPSRTLAVARTAGVILALDIRVDHAIAAVVDPCLTVLDRRPLSTKSRTLGADVATWVRARTEELGRGPLLAVAASVPAPVLSETNEVSPLTSTVHPWEGTRIFDELQSRLQVPTIVANDATMRAQYEAAHRPPRELPLLYFHLSSGIGIGLVGSDGHAWEGADGVAGNFAHVSLRSARDELCFCGREGCAASELTLRSVLEDIGAADIEELAARLRSREIHATQRVRRYASQLGELASIATNMLNPRTIVLGGEMSRLGDVVLSGVRAAIYDRSVPIVTRDLSVAFSEAKPESALAAVGAAGLRIADIASPSSHRRLENRA